MMIRFVVLGKSIMNQHHTGIFDKKISGESKRGEGVGER